MTDTPDTFAPAGPDRWSVRLERRYPHPIEKVWRAVSEPEHLQVWFPSTVELEPRVGAEVRFGSPMEGLPALTGEVTDCEPPHLLGFTWDTDHLRFELTPTADGTELVLLHTFDDRAGAASFGSGWDTCFGTLRADLAGEPLPEPTKAIARHEELVAVFGLDAPAVDTVDDDGSWRIVFERQMVVPQAEVWDLLLGVDQTTGEPRVAPGVGEPFTPWAAPDHILGTVTEMVPGEVLAYDCSAAEPGDTVRLHFAEGTGHGARLVVTLTGTDPADRDPARAQWQQGVENTAAQAAEKALATTS
ncbi:MAG TPA: SRPBCC family protein [Iamia sp.]